jgi:hypothetical protein
MKRMSYTATRLPHHFLPEVDLNGIALDTESYKSGRIAAAIFVGDHISEFT